MLKFLLEAPCHDENISTFLERPYVIKQEKPFFQVSGFQPQFFWGGGKSGKESCLGNQPQ